MLSQTINRLQKILEEVPSKLSDIPDADFSFKSSPTQWSKKEILGHLTDSAANNHQRFIRVQYENVPHIVYDQNQWAELSHHQQTDFKHLISFWTIYNQHILNVIRFIPEENLRRECHTGGEKNVTLGWLIDDYVVHMEHHLQQIIE